MRKLALILLLGTSGSMVQAQTAANITENPVSIGQERGLIIDKSKLVNDPVLRMPGIYKDYRIISYQVSCLPKGKDSELLGPFLIKSNDMTRGNAQVSYPKYNPETGYFSKK